MRHNTVVAILILLYRTTLASSDSPIQALEVSSDEEVLECVDRDPGCLSWAMSAECRRDNAYRYMKYNCPVSCNYCDPSLIKWTPLHLDNDDDDGDSKTMLTEKYDRVPIYEGVLQKTNFSDSPLIVDTIETMNGVFSGTDYYIRRVHDAIESMNTYLDLIYSDEVAFVGSDGQRVSDDTPYASLVDYSPVDIEGAPLGSRIPSIETCINRHPNCGLWAALGYCDSSKTVMARLCTPMCQSCNMNIRSKDTVVNEMATWVHSPFYRDDLTGVFDSIARNEIPIQEYSKGDYIPPKMKIITKNAGRINEVQHIALDGVKVKSIRWKRSEKDQELYREALQQSNGTGSVISNMAILEDLFNAEECQGLLDTVSFGIGVDSSRHDDTGVDGFPIFKSVDTKKDSNGTPTLVTRKSFRVHLFPSIKDSKGVMKYSNAIERLIIKVKLLTGMDALERVESPIVFDKHTVGDSQLVSSHFRSGISRHESHLFYSDDIRVNDEEQYEDFDKPDKMENARLFGLTVFLSGDGLATRGGEIFFPKMGGMKVYPKAGTAILFPTVSSLIEQNWSGESGALDENLDHIGTDSSFLIEDLYTTFGHRTVRQGIKYSVTFYFRRYEDEDRLPE